MKLISNKDIFQRVKVIIGSKKIKAVEDDPLLVSFFKVEHVEICPRFNIQPGSIFFVTPVFDRYKHFNFKTTDTMSGENRLRSLFITLGYFIEELSLFFH